MGDSRRHRQIVVQECDGEILRTRHWQLGPFAVVHEERWWRTMGWQFWVADRMFWPVQYGWGR